MKGNIRVLKRGIISKLINMIAVVIGYVWAVRQGVKRVSM